MKLIVGLGNIGKEYEKTKHNVGFMVVDKVAEELGLKFKERGCESDYAKSNLGGESFILAKPRTYMNDSGRAVKSLMKKFHIDIHDVMVVVDDIDLEPGRIRIRKNGSAGTHNGLKSIVFETQSSEFLRTRVGIGKQNEHEDLAGYVLSALKMTEAQILGIDNAKNVVLEYLNGKQPDELMSKFNGEK